VAELNTLSGPNLLPSGRRHQAADAPVLLLDDLLSELDAERRTHLLATLAHPDQQTLITATGMEDFDAPFLERARKMRVAGAQLYPW